MTLDEIKTKFQSELESKDGNPRSRRYSPAFKQAVIAAISTNNYSVSSIKDALGVSPTALSKWISGQMTVEDPGPEHFIAAKVVTKQDDSILPHSPGAPRMTLHLPNGVRLDF